MSVGQLAMLTVVAVASLRSLPAMADYGLASILLYLIPAVFFLVPAALVAAELATGWKGGVYVWVREAFGNRFGFLAIWLQWIQNVVWYPIQIAFIAVSLSYVFGAGNLGNNGVYIAAVIIVLYWISTMVALRGGNLFAKVGSISGLIGTLFPALLLIVFGAIWLGIGEPMHTSMHASALLPPWTGIASIVLIVSNVLAYAGMEVNAVHANDMKNPGHQFPRAIALATALILLVFILPTLAIAFAVPHRELGLIDGINLAFKEFFDHFGMSWGTPIISLLIAFGAFASVVTWIAGPSRGLLAAARTGLMPPMLQKRNAHGVQEGILIPQGVIVTVLALLFVLIPNGNTAFATLVDMATALYLVMYMLMFASAIRLRKIHPEVRRTYRVPAIRLIAGVGFIASAAAFVLTFVRPAGFTGLSTTAYAIGGRGCGGAWHATADSVCDAQVELGYAFGRGEERGLEGNAGESGRIVPVPPSSSKRKKLNHDRRLLPLEAQPPVRIPFKDRSRVRRRLRSAPDPHTRNPQDSHWWSGSESPPCRCTARR